MEIQLPATANEHIQKHLEANYPNEACGFFYGKIINEIRIIHEVHPVNNVKKGDQRRRFEIDPLDYMRAELHALETDQILLGIYHSHPDHPSIPSKHDLKQAVPFFSYIIASIVNGRQENIQSWRLKEDKSAFEEETIIQFINV